MKNTDLIKNTDPIKLIAAFFIPPLGVYMEKGIEKDFWINVVLTVLGGFPGIIHAFYVILTEK